MSDYRLAQLDLSTRLELVGRMLNPERLWGEVTQLSRQHHVSRKFLYTLQDKAVQALEPALAAHTPGPQPPSEPLVVNQAFIHRAIVVLPVVSGSVRGIQLGLDLLLGQHRSLGFIQQTLQQAGELAREQNASLSLPLPVLGEADEIFQGRQPCLTVVDGRSFLVLRLAAEQNRDATTWGSTFLDLQAQGVRFQDVACDGARGLRAGAQEAELGIPLPHDLFHLLQDAQPIARRLEAQAYQALAQAERARRAEQEAHAPKRRHGRPLRVKLTHPEAERQANRAIAHYDDWQWLLHEIRQALEPFTPSGQLTSVQAARETVETAAELLRLLGCTEVSAFAQQVLHTLDDLLAPLHWLEQQLQPWRQVLDRPTEAFIVWAWRHRDALQIQISRDFAEALQPIVNAVWAALSLFHRSSSLAESLHSWLRPYLQLHRGRPDWLLALLQLVWNHHPFQRGKRKGQSPLALATEKGLDVPSLSELVDRLVARLGSQPAVA